MTGLLSATTSCPENCINKIVVLSSVLIGLVLLSVALNLWQWIAACCFSLNGARLSSRSDTLPGVTLLKPLKGCDSETKSCLESWFCQDYTGPIQILFGVASATDPVCDIVNSLIVKHPQVDARLVICPKTLGANAKVSTLIQLESLACHSFVMVSDADVVVSTDFLGKMMAGFSSGDVGLVNCFYRLENPSTAAMQWEAIAVNADFWSQVLQGNMLKSMDFALGAVMAVRADYLQRIGGFSSLANYLADDYQLGHKIAATGARITICPAVAGCRADIMNWSQVWSHQLRWARTIRFCQPIPWFFSILSNATLWPLAAISFLPNRSSFIIVAIALVLRVVTALHNQFRLTNGCRHLLYFWLIPIKDLLQFALWAGSFLGSTVVWRGVTYRVLPGGKLLACK
ncbi:MAG: hypothetical protein JWM99_4033 [Verrucomicrobiales bacterium]|nr:hypothetical protein [Verrucomicrobiales bacterium]